MSLSTHPEAAYVLGELNYINPASLPAGQKPITYARDSDGVIKPPNYELESRTVPIHDLRKAGFNGFSLDQNGFQVVVQPSVMKYEDFFDQEKVKNVYHPEVENIIKKVTGAARTKVFDTVIRSPKTSIGAVARVHGDYTPASGPGRFREHFGDQADKILEGRVAIINLWRPLKTVYDQPLTIADASTVGPKDLIAQDFIYPHRVGETAAFNFNPNQKYYYISQQKPDEALLIKTYEKDANKAGFVPHSAFVDPNAAAQAPQRESLEIRVLVIWDQEASASL